MLIVHLLITLDLPYITSLKGRRKILNSLKEKLKHQNMAVTDVSGEYAKEASLALLFFAKNENEAHKKIEKVRNLLDNYMSDIEYTISYEIL
ncbi:DUF503 family protein [Nitratiruptor tergarcus]|uniref:YlxP-like protein n=1 Tax=Nitratiruptor tergarcus DSM 16512 TaxID=1069081 RepID=A0A1W1WUZ1_9BACT|nr:DUF503 family protein [Nitratiruptor tergarcus]SMC09543.1 hypothetical protein SAMN05660197_1360 [Nitratiruptor tergarcus DSM 16512]